MQARQKIRRRVKRRKPAVRRLPASGVIAARSESKQQMSAESNLVIGGAHDPAEKAADQMAENIIRMPNKRSVIHRQCNACLDEEQTLQRSSQSTSIAAGSQSTNASATAVNAINSMGTGRFMSKSEKSFFQPRFNTDLSDVRIHEGAAADKAAQSIDAKAFTIGSNVAFSKDGSSSDKKLMAHELAHVVQGDQAVRRTVKSNSVCANNSHGSPNNALAAITAADTSAKALSAAAHNLLLFAAATVRLTGSLNSTVVQAYYKWFDGPQLLRNGRYRSRFRTSSFATEELAAAHEMEVIASRFLRISNWFNSPIRYVCTGNSSFTIPGCPPGRCTANTGAQTCTSGARVVRICSFFWDPSVNATARGSFLAHEAGHTRFGWRNHSNSWRGRRNNPACYGSFIREIFGPRNIQTQCNPIAAMTFSPMQINVPASGGGGNNNTGTGNSGGAGNNDE